MLKTYPLPPDLLEMAAQFQGIARFDHSVSVPELGSLFRFDETNALGQMQKGVAGIYDVPFAYPITNGTTSLNVLALLTVARPGDTILCQRDSHVSIFAAMIHAGLRPVYVEPVYDSQLGINLGITPAQLHQALRNTPEAKAVFLTYPNYFGIAADLNACANVVAQRHLPLIVDAAHGSHFGFHPALPLPAQETTAAIVTLSTHKTCLALSQGSLALFNDTSLIPHFYEAVNQLGFISTSFSYVILASVVLAVWQLHEQGQPLLGQAIEAAEFVRTRVNQIEGLSCFGAESRQDGFVGFDPLRVTVDVSRLGLTGFTVEEQLIEEFGLYPEMATLQNVLFLFTMADDRSSAHRVVNALQALARRCSIGEPQPSLPVPPTPPQALPPRPAFFHPYKRPVPIYDSIGSVSAETIACYPPGSAIIVAGEIITPEVITYLEEIHRRGGVLKGASDPTFQTIQIIHQGV